MTQATKTQEDKHENDLEWQVKERDRLAAEARLRQDGSAQKAGEPEPVPEPEKPEKVERVEVKETKKDTVPAKKSK